ELKKKWKTIKTDTAGARAAELGRTARRHCAAMIPWSWPVPMLLLSAHAVPMNLSRALQLERDRATDAWRQGQGLLWFQHLRRAGGTSLCHLLHTVHHAKFVEGRSEACQPEDWKLRDARAVVGGGPVEGMWKLLALLSLAAAQDMHSMNGLLRRKCDFVRKEMGSGHKGWMNGQQWFGKLARLCNLPHQPAMPMESAPAMVHIEVPQLPQVQTAVAWAKHAAEHAAEEAAKSPA
ncbi:unnamed protein product, partial [Effrenium voratum]